MLWNSGTGHAVSSWQNLVAFLTSEPVYKYDSLKLYLGGGWSNIFWNFTPFPGEMIQFDERAYFCRWVVQTPTGYLLATLRFANCLRFEIRQLVGGFVMLDLSFWLFQGSFRISDITVQLKKCQSNQPGFWLPFFFSHLVVFTIIVWISSCSHMTSHQKMVAYRIFVWIKTCHSLMKYGCFRNRLKHLGFDNFCINAPYLTQIHAELLCKKRLISLISKHPNRIPQFFSMRCLDVFGKILDSLIQNRGYDEISTFCPEP